MYKRKISLYFGSITVRRAIQGIGIWLVSLFTNSDRQRQQLHQVIKDTYCPLSSGVFSFGSGRSALTACLKAANIGSGDEVLLSAYTCLAVPTAVIAAGAKPVYVDIDFDTLNVDADVVFANLSPRIRAIVVQHTLGKPAPIQEIISRAQALGILVIEDCALSLGSKIGANYVGTLAEAAIFSMELSKTLSAGWGGILVVKNEALAIDTAQLYSTLREPSWWASTRDLWQTVISSWCYQPTVPQKLEQYIMYTGFKSRFFRASTPKPEFDGQISPNFLLKMAGIQAALAVRQWRDFVKITALCEKNASILRETLSQLSIVTPGSPANNEIAVAPRVSLLVNDRELMIRYFRQQGVELGQWFDGPLSPIPTNSLFNYQAHDYPVSYQIAQKIVNLPCHSRLTDYDLQHIATLLKSFAKEYPGCVVQHLNKIGRSNLCVEL
ncbi:MAG: DegT/DnrJ/EryC1/StrS aminotransferase family protein [Legionella sp.]|nr:DegT/DnrJ/EryC1/StrS aminotransferase family protein [Legionella sp.]